MLRSKKAVASPFSIEPLDRRCLYSFTLSYNASTTTYTATDAGDVSTPHWVAYKSGNNGMIAQKDASGNVVQSANLGATGLQHLVVNLANQHNLFVTDSTVPTTISSGALIQIDVNGGSGIDSITTGVEVNKINGNGGDDSISAGAGKDSVSGGAGDDTINGGAGNDYVYGNTGADVLYSGSGSDHLYANDTSAYGDGVADILHVNSATVGSGSPDEGDTLISDQPD